MRVHVCVREGKVNSSGAEWSGILQIAGNFHPEPSAQGKGRAAACLRQAALVSVVEQATAAGPECLVGELTNPNGAVPSIHCKSKIGFICLSFHFIPTSAQAEHLNAPRALWEPRWASGTSTVAQFLLGI